MHQDQKRSQIAMELRQVQLGEFYQNVRQLAVSCNPNPKPETPNPKPETSRQLAVGSWQLAVGRKL
jgi:hypothetical protein